MIYFKTANITVLKNWIGCQNNFELLFIVINIPSNPILMSKKIDMSKHQENHVDYLKTIE